MNVILNYKKRYLAKREKIMRYLKEMDLISTTLEGAHYTMVNFSDHSLLSQFDDLELANFLLSEVKVAVVLGWFFYSHYKDGMHMLRLCYFLGEKEIFKGFNQLKVLINKGGYI